MTIGQRIRSRRHQLGLSIEEVAMRLGKNRATVYRYEQDGIENLSITVVEPLAAILECTPIDLLGWYDDPEKDILLEKKHVPSLFCETLSEYETIDWTESELKDIATYIDFLKSKKA